MFNRMEGMLSVMCNILTVSKHTTFNIGHFVDGFLIILLFRSEQNNHCEVDAISIRQILTNIVTAQH